MGPQLFITLGTVPVLPKYGPARKGCCDDENYVYDCKNYKCIDHYCCNTIIIFITIYRHRGRHYSRVRRGVRLRLPRSPRVTAGAFRECAWPRRRARSCCVEGGRGEAETRASRREHGPNNTVAHARARSGDSAERRDGGTRSGPWEPNAIRSLGGIEGSDSRAKGTRPGWLRAGARARAAPFWSPRPSALRVAFPWYGRTGSGGGGKRGRRRRRRRATGTAVPPPPSRSRQSVAQRRPTSVTHVRALLTVSLRFPLCFRSSDRAPRLRRPTSQPRAFFYMHSFRSPDGSVRSGVMFSPTPNPISRTVTYRKVSAVGCYLLLTHIVACFPRFSVTGWTDLNTQNTRA